MTTCTNGSRFGLTGGRGEEGVSTGEVTTDVGVPDACENGPDPLEHAAVTRPTTIRVPTTAGRFIRRIFDAERTIVRVYESDRSGAAGSLSPMADHKEVRYERLFVRVPGDDKLRKNAAGRLRHLLNTGWREIERVQTPDYVRVRLERTGFTPPYVKLKEAPAIAPRERRGGPGGFRGGPGGFRGGPGGFRGGGGPGAPRGGGGPGGARGGPRR